MGKIVVSAEPQDAKEPVYSQLDPVVEALLAAGNRLSRRERWGSTKEGFVCYLQLPIDFALVRERFSLPASVVLSEQRDLVACSLTWATIYGGIAPKGEW